MVTHRHGIFRSSFLAKDNQNSFCFLALIKDR